MQWLLLLLAYGTLSVTYKTDPEMDRLDRTRFWIIDSNHSSKFYPKQEAFVDDPDEKSRTVVIEGMQPGLYHINFIIPNRDNKFQKVPPKEVEITDGEITRVFQDFAS